MGLKDRYDFEKERTGHPEGFNVGAFEKIVAEKDTELTTLRQRLAEAEAEKAGVSALREASLAFGGDCAGCTAKDEALARFADERLGLEADLATMTITADAAKRFASDKVEELEAAQADAARWEGAARIMAKEIKVHRWSVDPGHHEETDEAIRITDQNPTASALVREGGGGA